MRTNPSRISTAFLITLSLFLTLMTTYVKAESKILTVTGKVEHSGMSFSFDDLKAQPHFQVETETIWTNKQHRYTAISVAQLLKKVGAKGENLRFIALNDYAIEVPVKLLLDNHAFIAFEQDGKPMRIRDKGPLWVLYPFTDSPQINTPFYQSHCAWQLKTIEVF